MKTHRRKNDRWNKMIEKEWITNGMQDEEPIDFCRRLGEYLANGEEEYKHYNKEKRAYEDRKIAPMSSSQLRKFFGSLRAVEQEGYENQKSKFLMLKPLLAYSVGRDKSVFPKITEFYEVVSNGMGYVNSNSEFSNYVNIIEAIVAYHKFYEKK